MSGSRSCVSDYSFKSCRWQILWEATIQLRYNCVSVLQVFYFCFINLLFLHLESNYIHYHKVTK